MIFVPVAWQQGKNIYTKISVIPNVQFNTMKMMLLHNVYPVLPSILDVIDVKQVQPVNKVIVILIMFIFLMIKNAIARPHQVM